MSDCSVSLQSRFLSSCMDFPAMMICFRTGLRKDTMVSCLLLELCSPPELPLAASFIFSSSTISDTLYRVYVAYQKSLWFTGMSLFLGNERPKTLSFTMLQFLGKFFLPPTSG